MGTLEVTPEAKSSLTPAPAAKNPGVISLPESNDEFDFLERALANLAGKRDRTIKPALFDTRPAYGPGFIRTDL
jgi:hypothetical protein